LFYYAVYAIIAWTHSTQTLEVIVGDMKIGTLNEEAPAVIGATALLKLPAARRVEVETFKPASEPRE
jgi:hypothetical protein